jgi:hypothetical protein
MHSPDCLSGGTTLSTRFFLFINISFGIENVDEVIDGIDKAME